MVTATRPAVAGNGWHWSAWPQEARNEKARARYQEKEAIKKADKLTRTLRPRQERLNGEFRETVLPDRALRAHRSAEGVAWYPEAGSVISTLVCGAARAHSLLRGST